MTAIFEPFFYKIEAHYLPVPADRAQLKRYKKD